MNKKSPLSAPSLSKLSAIKKRDKAFFMQRRFYFIYGIVVFLVVAVLIRFFCLQIIFPDQLISEGNKRSLRHQNTELSRGIIMDRSGRALAVSVPMYDVWADPKIAQRSLDLNSSNIRLKALADSISMPINELIKKLQQSSVRFVYLAKQITPADADYLKQLKLSGIYFDKTTKRFYPAGEPTAQIIGLTNINANLEQGIEGVEKVYQHDLSGGIDKRVIRRDRKGNVIEELANDKGENGKDVHLSIDIRLQNLLYHEIAQAVKFHAANSGTAVLLDIDTGEILAMASSPSYNPNNRLYIDPATLRNNAVTDAFEPGSTVKPFVVMAALEQQIVDLKTKINTEPFIVNKAEIKDVSYQKELDLAGILEKSSNVGVSKLALKMKPEDLINFYAKIGLGKSTDLNLPGESNGTINANKKYWSDIERATYAFGYGLLTTPMQLARAYAVMGAYGKYKPVSILKVDEAVKGEQVIDKNIAKTVLNLLDRATQKNLKLSIPNYNMAIKTGTAKKVGESGQYVNQYIAYTAGVAPASNPKYSLVVIIDNPTSGQFYGGAVSGPVFSRIMSSTLRIMNIKPDKK